MCYGVHLVRHADKEPTYRDMEARPQRRSNTLPTQTVKYREQQHHRKEPSRNIVRNKQIKQRAPAPRKYRLGAAGCTAGQVTREAEALPSEGDPYVRPSSPWQHATPGSYHPFILRLSTWYSRQVAILWEATDLVTRTCHTGAAMASDAHERARKRLEQPSEALLAELIMRDAALRQEAAAGM